MKKLLRLCTVFALVFILSVSTSLSALAATFTLPANLKTVEDEAFAGDTAVDTIVLPEGIRAIGSRAFADSSLKRINLPISITSIAADAFENSPNLKAEVQLDSYAMKWCEKNNVPFEIVGELGTSEGIPLSMSSNVSTIAMGEKATITLSADDGTPINDLYWRITVTYLNTKGEVVGAENYGGHNATFTLWPVCAGATKALLTVTDNFNFTAGKNSSIEIDLTGGDSYVYYKVNIDGRPYPGGKVRVYAAAVNAQYMSAPQSVVLTSEDGLINKTLGTLSAANPRLACDVDIPDVCQYDNGKWVEYYFDVHVGEEQFGFEFDSARPDSGDYQIWVDERCEMDVKIIPSELPYTYTVEDPSIATVVDGMIYGHSVGTTNATLTTASGYVCPFTIEIIDGSSSDVEGESPVLYVRPAAQAIKEGADTVMFNIYSAVPNSLNHESDAEFTLNFYDIDGNLIDTIDTGFWIYDEDGDGCVEYWPEWPWFEDLVGEDYRTIEIDLSTSGFETCDPNTASIRVIRRSEQGKLLFDFNEYNETSAGSTLTTTITCITPEQLKGVTAENPIKVFPLQPSYYAYDVFTASEPALFYEGKPSATLSVTLSDELTMGGYEIPIYCDTQSVGQIYAEISGGTSAVNTSIYMLVGDERRLISSTDNDALAHVSYIVQDPSILSVSSDGVATALKDGWTELIVMCMDVYGNRFSQWYDVNVSKPASADLPTLTMTTSTTPVKFGTPFPAQFKLSDCIYDAAGNAMEVELRVRAIYLDSNKQRLFSRSRWIYLDADKLTEGVAASLNLWSYDNDEIFDAAYVLLVPEYTDDVSHFRLSYTETYIPITDVPDNDAQTYFVALDRVSSEIQQGDYCHLDIYRSQYNVGSDVEVALVDAAGTPITLGYDEYGNEIHSKTWEDGSSSLNFGFYTDDFLPGNSYTLKLKIDDEIIDGATVSFTVKESSLSISGISDRVAAGITQTLRTYFSASDYTCPVTFSVSDATVASITGNQITYNAPGIITVTATCAHGQTAKRKVVVFDQNNNFLPTFYLENYYTNTAAVGWLDTLSVYLGTDDDLTEIPKPSQDVFYTVQFLDEDGKVLYTSTEDGYSFHTTHYLLVPKQQFSWYDKSVWLQGAEHNASYIRFDISADAGKMYYADPDRSSVTLPLPSLDTYQIPVIVYEYTDSVEAGGDFKVTFKCLNPNSLGTGRKVTINSDNDYDIIYASGLLTKEQPELTLSYTLPDDFDRGYIGFSYRTDGTTHHSAYVTVGKLTGISSGRKTYLGSTSYVYADYQGSLPTLTFTTSDASIVSIIDEGEDWVKIETLAKGYAEIIVSSQNGDRFTCPIVVYDADNIIAPAIGFSSEQTNTTIPWNKSCTLQIETTANPEDFSTFDLALTLDYLDANGSVIATSNRPSYPIDNFVLKTDSCEFKPEAVDMADAWKNGARSIRVTLNAIDDTYSVITGKASVTLAIQDPELEEDLVVFADVPKYVASGEPFDVIVTCLNPSKLSDAEIITITNADYTESTVVLTPEAPEATIALTIPKNYTNSYSIQFRGDNIFHFSQRVSCVSGYLDTISVTAVGSTCSASYSLNRYYDDLTLTFESSDESIATVDNNGVVTGVAPGVAIITMVYGPMRKSTPVRIFATNPEGTPTVELFNAAPEQEFSPNDHYNLGMRIVNGIESVGCYQSVTLQNDYLNDANEVVYSSSTNYSLSFNQGAEYLFGFSGGTELCCAVMRGATKVRFSLVEREDCVITGSSVTAAIQDTSEWTSNSFGYISSEKMYAGVEETVIVEMLSTNREDDCILTLTVYDNTGSILTETYTLTKANPRCELTFTPPETATSLRWNYTAKFVNSTYYAANSTIYPDFYYFTTKQNDMALATGSTRQANYYLNRSGIDRLYESSNPAVATVDESGIVTAVSTGIATITVRVDKMSHTFNVRVYDPAGTFVTPEVYLVNPDPTQTAHYNTNLKVGIATTTDVTQLGDGTSVYYSYEYVDANGNRVYDTTGTSNVYASYAVDNVVVAYTSFSSNFYSAVVAGATHVRVTLQSSGGYTIAPDAQSLMIPIRPANEWNSTMVYANEPSVFYEGNALVGIVKLLSYTEDDADETFTVRMTAYDSNGNYYFTDEEKTISAANPTARYEIPEPDDTANYVYFTYKVIRNSTGYQIRSDSWTSYRVRLKSVQGDMLLNIDNTQYVNFSGDNLSYVTKRYESNNPAVATIDSSGRVYAVSEGLATITVHLGSLSFSFNVRVYDSSKTYETPEFYLAPSDTSPSVAPGEPMYFCIGSNKEPTEMGGSQSVNLYYCFEDANGNSVLSQYSGSVTAIHAASSEATVLMTLSSDIAYAVQLGAVQMKLWISSSSYSNYTVNAERNTLVLPIKDAAQWTTTIFAQDLPKVIYGGESITVNVDMLSCAPSDADTNYICTYYAYNSNNSNYYINYVDQPISAANPTASYTFTVPTDTTSLYAGYSIRKENSASALYSGYSTSYIVCQAAQPGDASLYVGETRTAPTYNIINSSYVSATYESSDPDVVRVDENGNLYAESVGTAHITATFGQLQTGMDVRVYDKANIVSAKLSLSAAENQKWNWNLTGDLTITADQPIENLGGVSSVRIYSYYYDADGKQISSTSAYYPFSFVDSNTATIRIANSVAKDTLFTSGAVSVKHELYSLSGANGLSIDTTARSVTLPMAPSSEYSNPIVKLGTLSSTKMTSFEEYTMDVQALNTEYAQPVTLYAWTSLNGNNANRTRLGSVTFTPAESAEASLIITAPGDTTSTSFTLYVVLVNPDGSEKQLYSAYISLTPLPSAKKVTALADLQSEHNYTNSLNKAWSYTVEGAVSLDVTFDAQSRTESSYDKVRIGTMQEFKSGSFATILSGSIGERTVTVEGDTVVIHFTSDGSSVYWGFAVTQIVATMANGEIVTITQ